MKSLKELLSQGLELPLSEQKFLARAVTGSYIAEQEMYGNRTYWHGSHTSKMDGNDNPTVIDKLNPDTNYKETYFSIHFGYALTYALRLDDFNLFSSVANGTELIGNKTQTVPLNDRAKQLVLNSMKNRPANWWMIPFKIKPNTKLFYALDISDVRALFDSMVGSKNPKIYHFTRQFHTLEDFVDAMRPLGKIDWLAGIPSNYPFDRNELLTEIRNRVANGHHCWHGYINYEKGSYSSIGLFNEQLEQLSVGPLYQVNLIDNLLEIKRYGTSVNASIPPDVPPNKPLNETFDREEQIRKLFESE